jgi:5-methylcytosine-specific restriction protein B
VTEGTLYRASQHALSEEGAALLIIDEINRGPAVQIFGGAIVAIEAEKRLSPDGTPQLNTQFFEILDPKSGEMIEYAFPHHLYILAAMNQADVSVEPLDVAFLRRWTPHNLLPDEKVLRGYFGLPSLAQVLAVAPTTAAEVYEALVQAWDKVNSRIALGRSKEFQIGHGVVMAPSGTAPADVGSALELAAKSWSTIKAHLDEVFFGDLRGLAATLNASGQSPGNPYKLQEVFFADEPKQELVGPPKVTNALIYQVLSAVVG